MNEDNQTPDKKSQQVISNANANLATFNNTLTAPTDSDQTKKRRLSDAVKGAEQDEVGRKDASEKSGKAPDDEEVLSPEEAQKRTDELIAKLIAEE